MRPGAWCRHIERADCQGILLLVLVGMGTACTGAGHGADKPPPQEQGLLVYVAIDGSTPDFRDPAEATSRESLEHARVTFNPDEAGASALRVDLRMDYRNLTQTEFETIWGMTTGILLTVYPSTCRHRTYTLTATVTGANGESRSYEAADSTVAWVWLFQGDNCGEQPTAKEVESVTRRLLGDVYQDMARDNAFASVAAGFRAPPTPFVRFSVNRAQFIAEQVLRVDRPFQQWTMADPEPRQPDYQVDAHFNVLPGAPSLPRALLGIATAGIFGLCTPTLITLSAAVTDAGARTAKTYLFAKSLRGHADTLGCETEDESNHPEAFAELLRSLFSQIERDKVIAPLTATDAARPLPPLVRVVPVHAEGIVREATIRTAPFPRYYFGAPGDYAPDYTLEVDIEFQGGGPRKLGVAGSAGAGFVLGLSGKNLLCEVTTIVLRASLTARDGTPVAHYEIERQFAFSSNADVHDCHDNKDTNPNGVSTVVQELYRQMKDDGQRAMLAQPAAAAGLGP